MFRFLKDHPLVSVLVFLFGTFPVWLATLWPAFVRDQTVPEWFASQGWWRPTIWWLSLLLVLAAAAAALIWWLPGLPLRSFPRGRMPKATIVGRGVLVTMGIALAAALLVGVPWIVSQKSPKQLSVTNIPTPDALRVFYLLDVSASFQRRFDNSVEALLPAVRSMLLDRRWTTQHHSVVAIGAGLDDIDRLCEVDDRLTAPKVGLPLSKDVDLKVYRELASCLEGIRGRVGSQKTDIATSLRLAVLGMRRIQPSVRIIVMFTDVLDEGGAASGPPINLDDACVALVGDAGIGERGLNDLEDRMAAWQQRFIQWGALRAAWWHRAAFDSSEFREFVAGCRHLPVLR